MTRHFDNDRHALVTGAIAGALIGARHQLIPEVEVVDDDEGNHTNQLRVHFPDGETFLVEVTAEQLPER